LIIIMDFSGSKKFFALRSYREKPKFEEVFIEISASTISSIVFFLYGLFIFSNTSFQFAKFTQFRNQLSVAFIENQKENSLIGIYAWGIDPEARSKNENSLDLIADSLAIISKYAEVSPGVTVTVGLDAYFSDRSLVEKSNKEKLVNAMSNLPQNMRIVFGGTLHHNRDIFGFYRVEDLILSELLDPAAKLSKDGNLYNPLETCH
jgi:hypothetical protein